MKKALAQIQAISLFCPECGEAHYDREDHDWTAASITGGYRWRGGTIVSCESCGKKFRMPAIIDQIGQVAK